MMKKIVLAALSSAALFAGAGSAQAATTTASSGLTFTVGAACTLTAGVIDLGSYSLGDTVQTYVDRQGKGVSSAYTAGTDTAKQLASVTCPSGTAWTLAIEGTASANRVVVNDPSQTAVFVAYPYASALDGAAAGKWLLGNAPANTLSGTGTGSAQVVSGFFAAGDPTAAQLATALVQGQYTGAASAVLTY